VLVDVPRSLGVDWLEPGHAVTPNEFLAAEAATGTALRRGDVLFLRTGHTRRRREHRPWDAANLHAGLHVRVMPLLHQREVTAFACDSEGDAGPSSCDGVPWPIHAIGIASIGLHFFDHLDLEVLAAACAVEGRWEFMRVIAPFALEHATGSPVNSIAIL
jgi:kynurenine formamidase